MANRSALALHRAGDHLLGDAPCKKSGRTAEKLFPVEISATAVCFMKRGFCSTILGRETSCGRMSVLHVLERNWNVPTFAERSFELLVKREQKMKQCHQLYGSSAMNA
ncbi:unnamed protein product [Toxocara canis]|uniref:Transposase n=1 Tax=Toxocara canis TaxID=6265 RepID=A0A183VGB7_TOXCA|nr:unnamed protein product [Toxocara canis]